MIVSVVITIKVGPNLLEGLGVTGPFESYPSYLAIRPCASASSSFSVPVYKSKHSVETSEIRRVFPDLRSQLHGFQLDLILFGGCRDRDWMENKIIDGRAFLTNIESFDAEGKDIVVLFGRQETGIPPLHFGRRWTLRK